jgi:hypothetical protein
MAPLPARRGVDGDGQRTVAPGPTDKRSARLHIVHLVGFAGVAAFVVALAALSGLGNLNPAQHTVSEYSLGRYGWTMRAAFAALGLGALATAAGLRFTFEPSPWRSVGHLMIVGTAVGLFLDAWFNTDHLGVAETFDGAVHGDGMLIVCLTLPASACILGADFLRLFHSSRARWLVALGPLQAVAIIGFEVSPTDYRGVAERIAIAMGVATLALVQSFAHASARFPGGAGEDLSRSPELDGQLR